jgi:hypothetical protein
MKGMEVKVMLKRWILMFGFLTTLALACAQPFTYQGFLKDGGNPANGNYQMTFRLYDATGTLRGTVGPVSVLVSNGLFSVELNFPASVWDGGTRYLEIQVGSTTLSPRIKINPTPYASTLRMFESGVSNPDRMVITHSPAFTNWGLQYQDSTDKFNFLAGGTPVMTVDLGTQRVGINNASPIAPLSFASTTGNKISLWGSNASAHYGFGIQANLLQIYTDWDGAAVAFGVGSSTSFTERVRITGSGRVGIGTNNPQNLLTVGPNPTAPFNAGELAQFARTGDAYLVVRDGTAAVVLGSTSGVGFVGTQTNHALRVFTNNLERMRVTNTGDVGIGTNAPAAKLHVNGTARVNVLEITGADFAEKFPTTDEVQPGMVVEIDPDNPGNLRLARGAYNKRVAGIVAGANGLSKGIVLGNLEGSENHAPIAISGRVWVYADATEQAIEPGDFLTTAERPGYVMKATDLQKAQGAILGKAMTRLEKGQTGFVLVLVNLQ